MWRRLIAGWMVVSLVTLGVPVAASAVVPVARRVGLVERYAGPGRDAVNWKDNRFGVEQARQNQPVGVRRMLKGRPAPNAPNIRRQPPAFQPQAAAAQPTGQVRAEVQKGALRTGRVNGPDGSRSATIIRQVERTTTPTLAQQDDAYVQRSVEGVLNQINQAHRTLTWLSNLRDPHTWGVFLRGISDPRSPRAVVTEKPLTDTSGRVVGRVSWSYGYVGGTFVVKNISYNASITTPFGFAAAEINGGTGYAYNDRGLMTHATGSGTVTVARANGTSSTRNLSGGLVNRYDAYGRLVGREFLIR